MTRMVADLLAAAQAGGAAMKMLRADRAATTDGLMPDTFDLIEDLILSDAPFYALRRDCRGHADPDAPQGP